MKSADRLLVNQPEAMRLLGIRNDKFYALKKAGAFDCVELRGRQMVVFESLKRLAPPKVGA